MHPAALRSQVRALAAAGVPDGEIARRLGLARATVRDIRRTVEHALCPRCWGRTAPVACSPSDYAELFGLYLGDGHISDLARTQRLRISLDAAHPVVVIDTDALLRRCFPANRVGRTAFDDGATIVLHVYHRHLGCLFPQHGPGKKHHRRILLEPWQERLIAAAPWSFLRGLIRSDGCIFVNRTGRYAYLSFDFHNRSSDILGLFVATCEGVGLAPRRYAKYARIYRRGDVERLLANGVTKS